MPFGSADAATIEELPSCSTLLLRHLPPTTFVKLIAFIKRCPQRLQIPVKTPRCPPTPKMTNPKHQFRSELELKPRRPYQGLRSSRPKSWPLGLSLIPTNRSISLVTASYTTCLFFITLRSVPKSHGVGPLFEKGSHAASRSRKIL